MFCGERVLAVVPARGGSKGIPHKNLREVGGRSLLSLVAEAVRQCPEIDRCILSTDDPTIAEAGRAAGLAVPFLRPAELASDTARSVDAWRHTWLKAEQLDGVHYAFSVLLEPTSPLRRAQDIQETLATLVRTGAAAAATVSPTPAHYTPHKTLTVDEAGRIGFFLEGGAKFATRQLIPKFYHRNGLCYAARRTTVIDNRQIIENDCVAVPIDRIVVNIDDMFDLELAEFLIKRSS